MRILVWLLLWSSLGQWLRVVICASSDNSSNSKSPYQVIVDGGSTGSRLHVYYSNSNQITRLGSARSWSPLTAYADPQLSPMETAQHLIEAFQYAINMVPPQHHSRTTVKYAATAGMRLLSNEDQERVYQKLYEGLTRYANFSLTNNTISWPFYDLDIFTLSGSSEGFYGMVAANYLAGRIDADLKCKNCHLNDVEFPFLGALDMGGSSTQIVYHAASNDNNTALTIRQEDFYSHSYLSYGVDQFRHHLWNLIIAENQAENPCLFPNYQLKHNNVTMYGTGDATECSRLVKKLLPSLDGSIKQGAAVGGIAHPPLSGHFYAMSLYFFALDCLVSLAYPHDSDKRNQIQWPTPTLHSLIEAAQSFCARSWTHDLSLLVEPHAFTRPHVLPFRCYEAVYMTTLLVDGFGFDAHSRDISFKFDVNDQEVEWTLGMALSLEEESSLSTLDEEDTLIGSLVGELRMAYYLDMFGYHQLSI